MTAYLVTMAIIIGLFTIRGAVASDPVFDTTSGKIAKVVATAIMLGFFTWTVVLLRAQ
jgi:hypothetical protein